MVNSHYASFVPLLNQLQEHGKFSSCVPANSPNVKKISDYLFSELITHIKDNRFVHTGVFFDINGREYDKIIVSTVLSFNCQHVKCFTATKADFDLLLQYLGEVSRVYTHLFSQRQRFVFQEITIMYREVSG